MKLGSWHCVTVSKCVGIDVKQINMVVFSSMVLDKTTLMSTRLVVMASDASIDVLDVSSSGGVLWLLQYSVENHHSSRIIGEAMK